MKELVGLHGGSIVADSAEGSGTTVTIRLPFGAAHLPADSVASKADTRAASGLAAPYVQEALRWMPAYIESATDEITDLTLTPDTPSSRIPQSRQRVC